MVKKRTLQCYVADKTGIIRLRFFHFNTAQVNNLNKAAKIYAFGEVREFNQQLTMSHPEYQLLAADEEWQVDEHLTPIYPTTQGLTQNRLRQLVNLALKHYEQDLDQLEWMSLTQTRTLPFLSHCRSH